MVSLNGVLQPSLSESSGMFAHTADSLAPEGGSWDPALRRSCHVLHVHSEVPEPLCQAVVTSFWWCDKPCQKSASTACGDEQSLSRLSCRAPISSAPLGGFLLLTRSRGLLLLALNLARLLVWQVTSRRVEIVTLPRDHVLKKVDLSGAKSSDPNTSGPALCLTWVESAFCILTLAQTKN